MYTVNPAFDRLPEHAKIIGLILSSFGELELLFCSIANSASDNSNSTFESLYRLRMTSSRLEVAECLMRNGLESVGLGEEGATAFSAIMHCLKIRNQYAHCNWVDHPVDGLFFVDVQSSQWRPLHHHHRHVDVPLLEIQLGFFGYTREYLLYLDQHLSRRQGNAAALDWPVPIKYEPPPLHNPPAEHVPSFLDEENTNFHLAKALAAQGGAPTPTPKQQELDQQRQRKRLERQAQKDSAMQGRSNDAKKN
ncbi:hypothetical protein [Ferrovibrio sp.]|uniref:hypothetical protein n=1 Tax=Ferrovibrio sp. TaxID=1917215 RepID=UPI003D0DDED4